MEKLQPKLRFPEFNDAWSSKVFSELVDFKVTNSFSRDNLNYDFGSVKNIHYGDIHTKFQTLFDITKEIVPFVNEEISIVRISEDYYCKEGDLIFADASEDLKDVGKCIEIVNLDNQKTISGLHTLMARPKNNYFSKGFNGYLFCTENVRLQIQKEAQGSKVLSINVGRISNIILNYPSLPEQTKIASFLSAVDEKLNLLKEKKALLEEYKKGMMQKIFSQELRFKDENGKDFADWEVKSLGQLAHIKTGKLDANAMVLDGEYRFYTCAKEYYKIDNYAFDTEALLISGNGANVGYIHYYNGKFNAYQRTYVLDGFNENIHFIKYFLEQFLSKRILAEKNEGNTPYIVMSTLSEMKIAIPCLGEQTKIASFLFSIDEKIELVSQQIEDTQEYKKGLLQQMFC